MIPWGERSKVLTWDTITIGNITIPGHVRADLEAAAGRISPIATKAEVVIEMVLVEGEYRAAGVVDQAELEELDRQHEGGDIRAEDKLRIIRTGRR